MRNNQLYEAPVAPLGLGEIGLPIYYTPIAPLGLCKSGKMPDLRRGDIVGLHGSPFNPTYMLPNANTP